MFKSNGCLSIAKNTLELDLLPSLELIGSSAFNINIVSSGNPLFIMLDMNSGCAFLFIESLNKFVHKTYVGFMYGYIFIDDLSSTSNTAISNFALFDIVVPFTKLLAIPASIFDPKLLSSTLYPKPVNESIIKLFVVVFPFVPVTQIIFLGFAIFPKKSGQIFIANLPGNCDAFLPNNLITV